MSFATKRPIQNMSHIRHWGRLLAFRLAYVLVQIYRTEWSCRYSWNKYVGPPYTGPKFTRPACRARQQQLSIDINAEVGPAPDLSSKLAGRRCCYFRRDRRTTDNRPFRDAYRMLYGPRNNKAIVGRFLTSDKRWVGVVDYVYTYAICSMRGRCASSTADVGNLK